MKVQETYLGIKLGTAGDRHYPFVRSRLPAHSIADGRAGGDVVTKDRASVLEISRRKPHPVGLRGNIGP